MLTLRGIIPARAGFTIRQALCGGGCSGSSPLARGLLVRPRLHTAECRIIPARAGFTREYYCSHSEVADHPRSRGVYIHISTDSSAISGSSPLARGLLVGRSVRLRLARIIPARAGFTSPPPAAAGGGTDHPRSRGVYGRGTSVIRSADGSSPLARGLPGDKTTQNGRVRIIPARAGFTSRYRRRGICCKDHPRSRGVYAASTGTVMLTGGSSPLARGLPHKRHLFHVEHGIIPARAGFTD